MPNELKVITKRNGSYRLTVTYNKGFAQVSVQNVAQSNCPLVFSKPMSYDMAESYLFIFEHCGYVPIADTENIKIKRA